MTRFLKIAVFAFTAAVFFGCRELPHPFEYDPVIAQVGDKKLRQSDVQSNFSSLMTEEDSLSVLELYVDKWVTKEVKLRAAESMFRDSESDIEAMVNEYRNSLLMRKLDQYYVDHELDTTFTDSQIAEYYRQHASDFKLERTIVKGRQVHLPTRFRQSAKVRELIRSNDPNRIQDWRDMCQKNSLDMQEYDTWVEFTDFLATLPTRRGRDYTELLRLGELQEMSDVDGHYLFVITDIRRAGEVAPLERVRETIRRILFNQRQSEIIRAQEERLFREAMEEGDIKINIEHDTADSVANNNEKSIQNSKN